MGAFAWLKLKLLCGIFLLFWVWGHASEPVQVFCDDKDAESAVDVALVEHNKKLLRGNQFALYQIVSAKKAQNESDTVFTVDFQARESDCPVGGNKTWRDCDYLLNSSKAPSLCKATVLKSNLHGNQEVLFIYCVPRAEPPAVASHVHCLGCPEDIDTASEDLKEPLVYSVAKFNAEHNATHHFMLHKVSTATRQVVAGFKYDLQFDMTKSNCSKKDFKELTDECRQFEEITEFAHCNSTVYVAPWRRGEPEIHIDCAPGLHGRISKKRRPPGWSPLRNVPSLQLVAPPAPTPASSPNGTEESSEESQERTKATSLPATETLIPFNCPSKPWKSYVSTTVSVQAIPTHVPKSSAEEGDITDLDLL